MSFIYFDVTKLIQLMKCIYQTKLNLIHLMLLLE